MTNISFPIELDIENLEVKEVKQNKEGHYEIYVDSTQEGCTCHICGKHIDKSHYFDREKRIRHLSILGKETYLFIRVTKIPMSGM
ncbi:hypothetical protein QUF74_15515 [Candidatus Halobeggiatoa sp. HSG11]|nr:hypothetical protein [Candidatus Halobeggiatoa sp. HSG11]